MLNSLKTFVVAALLVGVSAVLPATARAEEAITLFDSTITVQPNTSIQIKEVIHYVTDETKHGIYRYVPLRFISNGVQYSTKIRQVSVADPSGKKIPFEQRIDSGNMVLKIGDADRTFTGAQTYVITYLVENAVRQVKDPDTGKLLPELYWDITGEGWQIPIASSSAVVKIDHAGIIRTACYSGAFGEDDGLCKLTLQNPHQAWFSYNRLIEYGDNMTVAVQFDPNGVWQFPTAWEKLLKKIIDNLVYLPLLLPGLIMGWRWWSRGRDWSFISWNVFNHNIERPQLRAPLWQTRGAPMVYEPIKELTPGEAGAMLDERADNQDVIAEIIELAHLKYLKIEKVEKKKLLGSETDYTFTKLKDGLGLPDHQQYLLEKLFKTGDVVKLSALKGTFSTHMEQVKKKIYKSLHDKGMFVSNPQSVRETSFAWAVLLTIGAVWWGIGLLNQELWWAIPLAGLSILTALAAAWQMPAKTAQGSNFAWQAKGLRETIDRGAWREKIKEKNLFFEEVLPFAVAFGVVDKLAKDMDKLKVKSPEYLPTDAAHRFNTYSFVNSFSSQASSSLSYNPNSSSGSSGSGFSGGSSGGGGGGGGGGSW